MKEIGGEWLVRLLHYLLPYEKISAFFRLFWGLFTNKKDVLNTKKYRKHVILWSGERVSNPPPAAWEAAAHIKDLS